MFRLVFVVRRGGWLRVRGFEQVAGSARVEAARCRQRLDLHAMELFVFEAAESTEDIGPADADVEQGLAGLAA